MKHFAIIISLVLSLLVSNKKTYAQVHTAPTCAQNFNLNWSTNMANDNFWPPGKLSNTYTNVNNSGTDITVTFAGETNTLGFWYGNTPKVGSQSSYLYKGIDLLSNGFSGPGITCTITFSQPVYAFSFDVHHINKWNSNGDKYVFTGKDVKGNTIYPEFTHSNTPSYTSDNNTGIVNAISNKISGDNAIIGVNYANSNYIKSVTFLWEDCDTCDHNLPHATGLGNFNFCMPQIIDFDGKDDYISTAPFLNGKKEVTMMSWIKLDKKSNGGHIIGQPYFNMSIDSNKKLRAHIKANEGNPIASPDLSEYFLQENLWYHVALKYDSNSGSAKLYLNGDAIWTYSNDDLLNNTLNNSTEWNAYDFEIGRNSETQNDYFEGSIYESKVFNIALNDNQLHQQINQEIENNNGKIRGSIIPKDIEGLLWRDLLLYYNMANTENGNVIDLSSNSRAGKINNIQLDQTRQDFTAPLPYVTTINSQGNWKNPENWENGTHLDINTKIPSHAIIKIKGDLEIDTNVETTGLIIDNNKTLKISNNSALINTWYLALDGVLDLEDNSQLIQTSTSTLNPTSSGILEKNIQGTADTYTYNYWSSPIGKPNNSSINNPYTVKDIFKDITFISTGYNGIISPLSVADYWIWKYNNSLSDKYSTWQQVRSTGNISPGEGFTMKGPGTGTITEVQDYVLQGKPNNGEISLPVYAGNDYLIGNPYPSAIDAVKFIQDNKSVIDGEGATDGTLYFWKHWGGGSHIASEYQGGYATYSLSGAVPAAGKSEDQGVFSTGGTQIELPSRYIPVGQGFYATAETNGHIKFNNSQRAYYSKSVLARKNTSTKNITENNEDPRTKLRIGFNSVGGLQRQLLVTVDENASTGYDWGYDSKYIDTQADDMYWLIDNQKYTIQGVNAFTKQSSIQLGIHTKTDGYNSIQIDEIKNTPADFDLYLHDKALDLYHDLSQGKYEAYLEAGEYLNRFELTFEKAHTLDIVENSMDQIEVYYSNEKANIVINNPKSKQIENIEMLNILGQTLFKYHTNTTQNHLEYNTQQITPGNYILKIDSEYGSVSKKVFIK